MSFFMRPQYLFLMTLIFFIPSKIFTQDERFFREILKGRKEKVKTDNLEKAHFIVNSKVYEVDLDDDGHQERLVFEKRDGQDWMFIYSLTHQRLFKKKFEQNGMNAGVYRINIRKVSKSHKVVLIHYYQGHTNYNKFNGQSKLYIFTVPKLQIMKSTMTDGPEVWEEVDDSNVHYRQRDYKITLPDLNKDGIREISVRHHKIVRTFYLNKDNLWKRPIYER